MKNTIIHLIGFGGVGKYTIAKEIASQVDIRLVDNHLLNNPVFSVIDLKNGGSLDQEVWVEIRKIRDAVFTAIETISPADYNFMFTNFLVNDENDKKLLDKTIALAEKRNATYVPVRILCDLEENVKRISNTQRTERFKPTNPDTAHRNHSKELINVQHPNVLNLDVTHLSPQDAAKQILDYTLNLQK